MTEEEILKEIKKLEEKRDKYWLKGNFAKASAFSAQIKNYNQRLQYIEERDKVTLHELLEDKPELIETFDLLTIMVTSLINATDFALVDINQNIAELTKGKQMLITDRIQRIKEEMGKVVHILDSNANAETAEDYGALSERLYLMARKECEKHLSWLNINRSEKVKYAEK